MKIKKFFLSPLSQFIYNIFSFIISLISIFLVGLEILKLVPSYLEEAFLDLDRLFSFIFFLEFLVRYWAADNKKKFLEWGWVDLVSAIPIYQFRVARIFKLIIILKGLKAIFQFKRIKDLSQKKSLENIVNSSFLAFILITVIVIIISTLMILFFEHQNKLGTSGTIRSIGDAFWWSFVTITTVGYGDFYPSTLGGRITAIILMLFGIGLFSSLSIYFSSFLINRFQKERSQKEMQKIYREIKELKKMIKDINKQ